MNKRKLSQTTLSVSYRKVYKCGAILSLQFVEDSKSLKKFLTELPIHPPMVIWVASEPRAVASRQLRGVFVTLPNLRPYNHFLSKVPEEDFANSPFNRPVLLNANSSVFHARLLQLCETIKMNFGEPVNHITIQSYDSTNKSHHNAHRDKTQNWVVNSSFFVLSLGEKRIFRVKQWSNADAPSQNLTEDIHLPEGSLLRVPSATNENYTHEVLKSSGLTETRFSIVFRQMRQI